MSSARHWPTAGIFGAGPTKWNPQRRKGAPTGLCGFCLPAADFGKTRCGAQWVIKQARAHPDARIALVGATAADVRDVMIAGHSGILRWSPPWFYPHYEPSKRLLTWPNGAKATSYSADVPDRLRGPQHFFAWGDEAAAWSRGTDVWAQLMFGLRLGQKPKCVVTTTPRPIKLIRDLVSSPDTFVTHGTTYDNLANLAPSFKQTILSKFEGSRLAAQELYAKLLDDVPNALWKREQFELCRLRGPIPHLARVVVGVDPAASSKAKSNNTGIVVCALGKDKRYYVLEDATIHDKPNVWAAQVVAMYHKHKADLVVGESNCGGDMVETVIKVVDPAVAYKSVHAARNKHTRAEPIATLYEQGRVLHCGIFENLEDEMCTYDPLVDDQSSSPDRMDALVWALWELHNHTRPTYTNMRLDLSPIRQNPLAGV